MSREKGSCPFTGRVDQWLFLQGQAGEPELLELAHIVTQPFSKGIEGVSERACQKVGSLPKTTLPRATLKLFPPFKVQLGKYRWGYH